MRKFEYPALGEIRYAQTLPNGLTVCVVPRQGFSKKTAYFVTDFGSIHTAFRLDGKTYHVPAGIAHFLEHKMFDMPDGRDVSAQLASLGAMVNAFTSYDMTAYYISCTENFEQALRILIEFVSTAYFTEETIQKELGIIDQEIGMNEDTPDNCLFESLMHAMYESHPIRVPILGTSQSIRQITPDDLYACHRAFYTPANMMLCVVGDVDPEQVCRIATQVLGDQVQSVGEKLRCWPEQMTPVGQCPNMEMEVAMPMFNLAFKCEPVGLGEAAIRQEMVADLAAEALFGESSGLYLKLYEAGLIDSSFGGGFETIDGMAMLLCSGDSDDAPAVQAAILERAQELVRCGIDEADFIRMKRSVLGRRIRDLDSFSSLCFRLCAYGLSHFDYFDFPRVYRSIQTEDLLQFIHRVVQPARCVLGIVNPI